MSAIGSSLFFDHVDQSGHKWAPPSLHHGIDIQLKKWACDWDHRVFQDKLITPFSPNFLYNEHQHWKISKLVDTYHTTQPERAGKDRFVWACFACAIIKEHKYRLSLNQGRSCHTLCVSGEAGNLHSCFYVLLWISFHLRLPTTEIVEEILAEVLSCTKSLKFLFSFLPSMSLKLYIQLLWSKPWRVEDKLCIEFFSLFDVDLHPRSFCKNAFNLAQPMLLYLVQHLPPLHRDANRVNQSSRTLAYIVNKPILYGRKFSLLYIGIQFHDRELVEAALARGALADKSYWDAITESYTSAEKTLVSSVNAIVGTQQFLARLMPEPTDFFISNMDAISHYAPLILRSLYRPQMRKSSGKWSEESIYELNCQIADTWGIECKPDFPLLQHACKVVIRRQIFKADKMLLPQAAQQLPLPQKLIRYINLELD
ncbi:hypothetical protein ElyMa_001138300 [Elysia marginata]|uniref:SOCS box domain-containing protein n=1 Tax=Elysia marginata TaxID=1093978 RepID=A0AAV4I244_9GAST|nr:hypothetical protein ElyMa_001138300 [Elysia marginata]